MSFPAIVQRLANHRLQPPRRLLRRAGTAPALRVALIAAAVLLAGIGPDVLANDASTPAAYQGHASPYWVRLLLTGKTPDRQQAAYALWNLANEQAPHIAGAAPALGKAVTDKDAYVRSTAIQAIEKLGEGATGAVPGIAAGAQDKRANVRRDAVILLFQLKTIAAPAAPVMAPLLHDPDPVVRANAAAVLANVAAQTPKVRAAVPGLVSELADSNSTARLWAEKALALIDPHELVPRLAKELTSSDPAKRAEAAGSLGYARHAAKSVAPKLIHLLTDRDPSVRAAAARALGAIAPQEAVGPLGRALKDSDASVRANAAEALSYGGPVADALLPQLYLALLDDDPTVRTQALGAIWSLGPPSAVTDSLASIRDPDPAVRSAAVRSLGSLGAGGADMVPMLEKLLGDSAAPVRAAAANALQGIGAPARPAVPALIARMTDDDANVRLSSVRALRRWAASERRVVLTLAHRLHDGNAGVRLVATRELLSLGPKASPAVPALTTMLGAADDGPPRRLSERILASIGPSARAALPALKKRLASDGGDIAAAFALLKIDPTLPDDPVRVLSRALADPTRVVAAVRYLGRAGPVAQDAVPLLIEVMNRSEGARTPSALAILQIAGPDSKSGQLAMENLRYMLSAEGLPSLGARAAARAFAELGPAAKSAVPDLVRTLSTKDPILRRLVADALAAMGPEAKSALPALGKLLTDADPAVKVAAEHAIATIRGG